MKSVLLKTGLLVIVLLFVFLLTSCTDSSDTTDETTEIISPENERKSTETSIFTLPVSKTKSEEKMGRRFTVFRRLSC